MNERAENSAAGPAAGFDRPEAYIPGDRRRALAAGAALPDRVHGAALFADISGFTPLTEALAGELGPQRGAEEITANLNRVFHGLISDLDRFGGHVIYFSGDAITCWLDGDDGMRAAACALAMQATMEDLHEVVTPGGTKVPLAMKVSIAVGEARRFIVGDPDVQRIDVLAGRLIDALANAERLAERGDVVLDASALEALGERVDVAAMRTDEASGRRCAVVRALRVPVPATAQDAGEAPLAENVVREWVLPAVYQRLTTGRGEFLAELRPAFPLFVRFGGIDYDDDDDAIAKLDDFIRHVQRIVSSFGGNLLNLTLGDKGGYVYAAFGAPQAHEDDAARAAAAALELRDLSATTASGAIQIGITQGRLLSGAYGHAMRQTFTCLGDAVNLSARLMSAAPAGQIYVSEPVRRAAGDVFAWEPLDPIKVKGKSEPVVAFALTGSKRRATRRQGHELPIVGRWRELETMGGWLDQALGGEGRIVGVSAEAGMGKSRLVAEFVRTATERGISVAIGECQAYGSHTSYFVWRDIWWTLLGLDAERSPQEQVRALEAELAAIDPALVQRAPLLDGLLDLHIPDNELTATFDAKLRKTSLEGLLVETLRAKTREGPVVIVLEDCHWVDPLSRDLLEVLGRAAAELRALIVLAYRPATSVGGGLGLENMPHFAEIALAELDDEHAAQLVRSKLAQMTGVDTEPPASLIELVTKRSQGNPFYIEELLSFIRSRGVDPQDEAALRNIELPESLHSLILSRIDALDERPRRTLKVASVLGRVFRAPMLPGVYPELGPLAAVEDDLRTLAAVDLVNVEQEEERSFLFKHVVTQEVAYESMPFALRSTLHERVGGYIETTEGHAIERNLDLLAHHYWHSGNLPKKREYLLRAGVAAQANYANAAAIGYFERLSPLVEDNARIDALLKLGKVLDLTGKWNEAAQVETQALSLAERLHDPAAQAACETALAEEARKQGRYDEAIERLGRAAQVFRSSGNDKGLGEVLHLAGNVAAQRGDYDKAVESYEASLAIRERLGDKERIGALVSNLGILAEYRGDLEGSRNLHERALALRTEVGDRREIANSLNNLGMIDYLHKDFSGACERFQKSILLMREVGDSWNVALSQQNLGNATREMADYDAARRHYADCMQTYRDYDDKWALAFVLEDVGILAALSGDPGAALELLGAADALREALGTPRSPSLERQIGDQIATSVVSLSDEEQNACRARGRALDFGAALERALFVCG